MNTLDWDLIFREAPRSLCVSNRNPKPDNDTAENVFERDEKQIMAAAAKHGFTLLFTPSPKFPRFCAGLKGSPVYSFVKRGQTPFVPVLNTGT